MGRGQHKRNIGYYINVNKPPASCYDLLGIVVTEDAVSCWSSKANWPLDPGVDWVASMRESFPNCKKSNASSHIENVKSGPDSLF